MRTYPVKMRRTKMNGKRITNLGLMTMNMSFDTVYHQTMHHLVERVDMLPGSITRAGLKWSVLIGMTRRMHSHWPTWNGGFMVQSQKTKASTLTGSIVTLLRYKVSVLNSSV